MAKKKVWVSIWVFKDKAEFDDQEQFLKDDLGIKDYDEDYLGVGGSEDWNEMPLEEALSEMSYFEYWGAKALSNAAALGVTHCRRLFMLLHVKYDPAGIQNLPKDPLFLGSFVFERKVFSG